MKELENIASQYLDYARIKNLHFLLPVPGGIFGGGGQA
jgi:hypothetical protein